MAAFIVQWLTRTAAIHWDSVAYKPKKYLSTLYMKYSLTPNTGDIGVWDVTSEAFQ